MTVDGIKNIEDIRVGDWVIADDPTTPGGIEAKQVLDTFVRETDALVDLYVDGEVISTTGEHPFWVPDKGWVKAKDLVVGSLLQTGDGRIVDVDKVERREGKFPVYNFKVEGIPTYFVSELGVLVHNATYNNGPTDDMWDDFFRESNNFHDPVNDAVNHFRKKSPEELLERLRELGAQSVDDLSEIFNDMMNNASQIWTRPDGATAYVNSQARTVFIDNPNLGKDSTAFRRNDYADYLRKDGFKPE